MIYTPYGYPEPSQAHLSATEFINCDHSAVRDFAATAIAGATGDTDKAVRLFYAARDQVRYDLYSVSADRRRYCASDVLRRGAAYCIPKAVLLAAAARAVGIPSAIGLSDVVNHFTTPKVEAIMGKDAVFLNHGYVALFVAGEWRKVVPAFNAELCAIMAVAPTEFDGHSDALLQEFDTDNNRRMVYLKDHGVWSDLPLRRILDDFKSYYPEALFAVDG